MTDEICGNIVLHFIKIVTDFYANKYGTVQPFDSLSLLLQSITAQCVQNWWVKHSIMQYNSVLKHFEQSF